MKVRLDEIRQKMSDLLTAKGYKPADIPFIIDMYLGGEQRGHTSHGLASFPGFAKDDFTSYPDPEVIKDTPSLYMIDAKSNSGVIVGRLAADEAIKRAKENVVGTAIIKNMDSWLRPGGVAEYIAKQGYLAIVINDGGSRSIAPPGGYQAVLGTNPIAYGIPTEHQPLVVDMATSKRAWGEVRLANKYGTELPANTFYDAQGVITHDPKQAESVLPAGGHKGFALALLIEVMGGSLVGMDNMMLEKPGVGGTFGARLQDRGGFILVIDPGQTSDLQTFKHANTDLLERIKQTSALPGQVVRIPGEQALELQEQNLDENSIEIPNELWDELNSL